MLPLYKYISSKHVPAFLNQGEILFRNLTYFRQIEGKVRGDSYEGIHINDPKTTITISNPFEGVWSEGNYTFLNSTNSDLVYAFCLSEDLSKNLMLEFNCDSCIEIFNPDEFIRRVRHSIARLISINQKVGLLAQSVNYYHPSEPALFNVDDPTQLAFAKKESYKKQKEFRLSFGTRKAFKLVQQIAQPHHDPYLDAINKEAKEKLLRIGSLNDVARIIEL